MKLLRTKKNRGSAPYEAKGFRSGFVIIFAVTLSAILLSIALGVANVALKEIKFSTSAKDTNNAFFAADTGMECAFFNDKSTSYSFVSGGTMRVACLGSNISLSGSYPIWSFVVTGLGNTNQACAKVTVNKTNPLTTVVSKGYNNGSGVGTCTQGPNTVERELDSTY